MLGLAVCFGTELVGAGGASAHASLVSITPADGATLPTPPDVVTLTFDEPVTTGLSVVAVRGVDGTDAARGEPSAAGATLTQRLATRLPAGTYTISWKVVSDDGHPVSGTSTFTATAAGAAPATATPGTSPSAGTSSTPGATPRPTTSSSSTASSGVLWFIAVALIVFGVLGWVRALRRQRRLRERHTEQRGDDPSATGHSS